MANATASGTEPTASGDGFGAAAQQSTSSTDDSSTSDASTSDTGTPSPSTPQFDPPQQFNDDYNAGTDIPYNIATAVSISAEPVVWGEDGAVFVYNTQDPDVSSGAASEAVQRFDALQTTPTWQVTLAGASTDAFASTGAAPALAPVSGKPAVIALYVVAIPPNGTVPGHPELHAKAIDAASGSVDWDTVIIKGGNNAGVNAQIAGSDDAVLAISATVDEKQETLAVNTTNGAVLWTAHSLNARMVARGVIVADKGDGTLDNNGRDTLVGVSETDPSKVVWSSASYSFSDDIKTMADYGTTALDAGPRLIQPYSITGRSILDAATGKPVSLPMDLDKCFYDHQATVACSDGYTSTVAFDATTWKQLWSLPDAASNRSMLAITAVWHGLVYGTANGTPVALDARSGADKVTNLSVAPKLVRPGFCVLPGGGLNNTPDREYPATQ